LNEWLSAKNFSRGAIASAQSVYDLGRDWYATRLRADWQPATASEAMAIFTKHGFTGPFWTLG
jgi:hypothetical protein